MSKVGRASVVVDQAQFAQVGLESERVARADWQDDDRSLHADVQPHLVGIHIAARDNVEYLPCSYL